MRVRRPSSDLQDVLSQAQVLQMAPIMAGTLNLETAVVGNALAGALDALVEKQANSKREMMLNLSHQCRNVGCRKPGCDLCCCNPNKQCMRQLDVKYLAFEAIKSGCGADLTVQLVHQDGTPAASEVAADIYLQMKLLDATAAQATQATSNDASAAAALLQACILPVNKEGKPLLVSTDGKGCNDYWVTVPMRGPEISLPRLSITESSEALMAGQKPPMQLFIQAVDAQGEVIHNIPPFLSEEFVVTTIRSSSRKPEIPLMGDPVCKLQSIGKETVAKLKDLSAAALASPNPEDASTLQDFTGHTNNVTTVEQFCKLTTWCEQDQLRSKCVQRVLKVMRGWDAATTHAKTAVPEDTRPRVFGLGTGMVLLYSCKQGKVDIKKATGCLSQKDSGLAFAPMTAMTQEDVQQIPLLERQAQQQWHQVGHPGWSLQPLADQGVSATGHLLSPQRSLSKQDSPVGRRNATALIGCKRRTPCALNPSETVDSRRESHLNLDKAFQGLPDALGLPGPQDALSLDSALSNMTQSTSGLDTLVSTAMNGSPPTPAGRLFSQGYDAAQIVPNLHNMFSEGQVTGGEEVPNSTFLRSSPSKRQALAPSSCNLMPSLWPACVSPQLPGLPLHSELASPVDASRSMHCMSADFECHSRSKDAACGMPCAAEELLKHCEPYSRLMTPMPQMQTPGQQVVPNHMAGFMPSIYSWGPLAEPMCPRQELGFSVFEAGQEMDSFMSGEAIPMHL